MKFGSKKPENVLNNIYFASTKYKRQEKELQLDVDKISKHQKLMLKFIALNKKALSSHIFTFHGPWFNKKITVA